MGQEVHEQLAIARRDVSVHHTSVREIRYQPFAVCCSCVSETSNIVRVCVSYET